MENRKKTSPKPGLPPAQNNNHDNVYKSILFCAEILGVAKETVRLWNVKGYVRVNPDGQYNLIDCIRHRLDMLNKQKDPYYLEKTRNMQEAANIKELQRKELEGSLVKAESVKQIWDDFLVKARSKLLAIPSALALELESNTSSYIEKRLTESISEALKELN